MCYCKNLDVSACDTGLGEPSVFSKCCTGSSFLDTDVSGQHVWLNMCISDAPEYLKHYLSCKGKSPCDTSAVVVVPKCRKSKYKYVLRNMLLLQEFDASKAPALSATMLEQSWPMQVYWDPCDRQPTLSACGKSGLTMQFGCSVQGHYGTLMADSGASHEFLNAPMARQIGLRLDPAGVATAELADGRVVPVVGSAKVQLRVQGTYQTVTVLVAELSNDWDIILGDSWFKAHGAELSWEHRQLRYRRSRKRYVWRCHDMDADESVGSGSGSMFLNTVQLQRALDDGCDAFYVHVTAKSDRDTPESETQSTHVHAPLETGIKQLLHEFTDRFPDDLTMLPPEREVDHVIPLEDPASVPPFKALYRMSPAQHAEVEKQVTELLSKGYGI